MRIGGIASGIDTDTIIKQLMQAERRPLDRFFQRKQTIEWQRDIYRDMNLKLKSLEESAFSIRLTSAFNSKQATSSNQSAFTATANVGVQNGTYQLKVEQVATKSRNISHEKISAPGTGVNPNGKLSEQTAALGSNIADYNNDVFTITTYNSAGNAVTKNFTVNTDESLNDLLKKINDDTTLGVRAYYDGLHDKVVFERKDTGEFNGQEIGGEKRQIIFGGTTDFLTDVLKVDQTNEQSGVDARVKFKNPIFGDNPIVQTSRSNRITVGGITFDVAQKTKDDTVQTELDNDGNVIGTNIVEHYETVTVTSNTDQAFNNIKAFVDKYNETIASIQEKLQEPRNRKFPPLTDEQRKGMSEREAELWDEKAKSGMLRNDSMLNSILSEMRTQLYSPVKTTGRYTQLTQVGITTSSNFRDGGKLEIDETQLRKALEEDPEGVHQLFNNIADKDLTDIPLAQRSVEERSEINRQSGLIGRIRSTISNGMNNIMERAGSTTRTNDQFTLGKELTDIDKRIEQFERKLMDIENRYWTQFGRMEKLVNQANQQGAQLMQAFMNFQQ